MTATTVQLKISRPHEAQMLMLQCDARFIAARCGRRFGKTKFIPIKRIKKLLAGEPIAYFAPSYKMLQHYWRETKQLLEPITKHVSKQEHRLELITGGSYDFWSLDNPDAARGQKYAAADIDEAAMIPELEEAWNAVIRPTLTDYEGQAGFWSTPKGLNFFHTLCSRGSDEAYGDWKEFHFPTSANPFIKQSEIDAAEQELPADVFRQEYLAEFIQGEGAVFRNITANLTKVLTTPEQHKGHRLSAGVDWGQVNDFTVISVGCETCKREVYLDRFNKIDWNFQRERLLKTIKEWNVQNTLVEENSIGSPNLQELHRTGIRVRGFQMTASSKPALIQSLALTFEKEEMKFLDIPIATRELEAYEAKKSESTGRISYNAPSGFHDDTVIARGLMRNAILNRGVGVHI